MNDPVFFSTIRKTLFDGALNQSQVDGIKGLLAAFDQVGDKDQDTLAYGLATAYHETGRRMVPVREGFAKTDAGARSAVAKLAKKRGPNSAPAKYGKAAGPYGHAYYGRGHVQLTWLENYQRSSADAGTDLVANPDAMLDPVVSARVLFRGLMDGRWNGKGKGLSAYEGDDDHLSDAEAAEARRTVNVQDKALEIARYHRRFYDALDLAGWEPGQTVPPAKPRPDTGSPVRRGPTPKQAAGTVAGVGLITAAIALWDKVEAAGLWFINLF
jgi:predicted chitinase